jgi:hypothetical protein
MSNIIALLSSTKNIYIIKQYIPNFKVEIHIFVLHQMLDNCICHILYAEIQNKHCHILYAEIQNKHSGMTNTYQDKMPGHLNTSRSFS